MEIYTMVIMKSCMKILQKLSYVVPMKREPHTGLDFLFFFLRWVAEPVLPWDFHEIRPASFCQCYHSISRSMASGFSSRIVVDFKPFKETSSMRVCPSVGSSVFVRAPAAEPSWHSAETSRHQDWEIAVESSPKMSIHFPFEAFKQTETIF